MKKYAVESVILLVCIFFAMSLYVVADESSFVEKGKDVTEKLQMLQLEMLYFRFVDERENPIQQLVINGSVSDSDGFLEIDSGLLKNINSKTTLVAYNMFSDEEKVYTLNSASKNPDEPTILIWNLDTPRESVYKQKNKVIFRVVDENGNPLQGAEFKQFISKDMGVAKKSMKKLLSVDYPMLPTDKNGETAYIGNPLKNNSVTLKYEDNEKRYIINISEKNLKNNKVYKFTVPLK